MSRASACATSGRAEELGSPDLVVIPGSKTTVADLDWLRAQGLAERIVAARRGGTPVIGVCAGYQMLGRALLDPDGVESPRAESHGLGLLRTSTTFRDPKVDTPGEGTRGGGPWSPERLSRFRGHRL